MISDVVRLLAGSNTGSSWIVSCCGVITPADSANSTTALQQHHHHHQYSCLSWHSRKETLSARLNVIFNQDDWLAGWLAHQYFVVSLSLYHSIYIYHVINSNKSFCETKYKKTFNSLSSASQKQSFRFKWSCLRVVVKEFANSLKSPSNNSFTCSF